MSRENVEVVRAGFEAWNRQDLDGWLAILHPDVEFQTSGVFPDFDRVYRGHEGVRKFWLAMHEPWETLRLELQHIEAEGDWVIYVFRFRVKGVDSGAEADLEFANAARLSHGLVIEIVARRSVGEARETVAAGQRTMRLRE